MDTRKRCTQTDHHESTNDYRKGEMNDILAPGSSP